MVINKMDRRLSPGDEVGVKRTEARIPFYYFSILDIFSIDRFYVAPMIIDSPVGPMTTFSNMQVGDNPFGPEVSLEQGLYTVYIFCKTTPNSGIVTFNFTPEESIEYDFYSPLPNFTVFSNGIKILLTSKVILNMTVTGKQTDSSGYDVTIGDIVLSKYK